MSFALFPEKHQTSRYGRSSTTAWSVEVCEEEKKNVRLVGGAAKLEKTISKIAAKQRRRLSTVQSIVKHSLKMYITMDVISSHIISRWMFFFRQNTYVANTT